MCTNDIHIIYIYILKDESIINIYKARNYCKASSIMGTVNRVNVYLLIKHLYGRIEYRIRFTKDRSMWEVFGIEMFEKAKNEKLCHGSAHQ